jgi:hypothetical protein
LCSTIDQASCDAARSYDYATKWKSVCRIAGIR